MSYTDDNAPYLCSENTDVTLEKLESRNLENHDLNHD